MSSTGWTLRKYHVCREGIPMYEVFVKNERDAATIAKLLDLLAGHCIHSVTTEITPCPPFPGWENADNEGWDQWPGNEWTCDDEQTDNNRADDTERITQ